ncbi:MAG: sodium-dependent transporter [Burkholderiaceae bacterium]
MTRDSWSGRAGFILATIGSAVGIGSIWKFPYELGANGGSGFLLFYVLGLVAVVVPLMFAEFAIGQRGRADAAASLEAVAREAGASPRWRWAGAFGVLAGFLILSYYAVIGGWTLAYAARTAVQGLPAATAGAAQARFDAFLAEPWAMLGWHALFMAATAWVVARGVAGGIEAASKVLMPVLFALMAVLVTYAAVAGDLRATVAFLFEPRLDRIGPRTALEALGLGFFSIGVGLGLMITFAAYSTSRVGLVQVALVSVLADTAISLMAGFMVFPIVFAHGLDPASGPGLVFVTMPIAFARLPLGTAAAAGFFLLLGVAALASAISMLELVVALLVRVLGWPRPRTTLAAALACFALGVPTVLSFNLWADWHPLAFVPTFAKATFFDLIDELTSNAMLPLGGLAIAVFAGHVMTRQLLGDALGVRARGAKWLAFALRWLAPALIVLTALAPLLGVR